VLILLHILFNIITIMRFQPVSGAFFDQMVRFDPPLFWRGGVQLQ